VKPQRADKGLALIFVLWALVILMTVAGSAAFGVRKSFIAERTYYERLRAEWLARAGVERAADFLASEDASVDGPDDTWANDEDEEFAKAEIGEGGFELIRDSFDDEGEPAYGLIDEASKLNVNTATYDQLMEIPEMTEEIADSIIDWRDGDSELRANGAEADYYGERQPPYEAKNAPFESIRELLLVKGVEPEIFFGEDVDADGVLDENEDDEDESAPVDNGDGVLDRGLVAYLTASSFVRNVDSDGNKRVNIKTADESELKKVGFSADAAKAIVDYRKSKGFSSIADLLDVTIQQKDTEGKGRAGGQKGKAASVNAVSESTLKKLADKLTVSDEEILPGRVNVNTAPLAVLRAVFQDETIAQAVHEYARSADGPFKNIAELLDVEGISKDNFKEFANYVTVRSNVFRVRSTGYLGEDEPRVTVEALLVRDGGKVKIVNVRLAQ